MRSVIARHPASSAASPSSQLSRSRARLVSFKSASVVASLVVGACFSAGSSGCLSRDVASDAPTVKTNFGVNVQQTAVDKVDLLFMIDNSTSMGDKQFLLEQAVPVLVSRLVTPNCIDGSGNAITVSGTVQVADSNGKCATGSPEFPAVHDMHIGVVSSSLGDFGVSSTGSGYPEVCGDPAYPAQDDHAHLLNRDPTKFDSSGTATTDATATNYLAWFPTSENVGKTAPAKPYVQSGATLGTDFTSVVSGVQQFGCGLEAQLESWYEFLIQPDPWVNISVTNQVATRVGVDTTTLAQRRAFLRPDSLVAVIGLSDEDDSTVDPGAFGGQSWIFNRNNPATSPLPTTACATDPNSSSCTSCALFASGTAPAECQVNSGNYANADDNLNVRFQHMKQRFGIDPQYPVSRYLNGLKNSTVPNRSGEGHKANLYSPTNNCTNPLYASELPDPSKLSAGIATATTISAADAATLCTLGVGSRSQQLVFFGFIGGVPWQLLTESPATATETNSVAFKAALTDADWKTIIGNSPETYDYSGQDIHMVQSTSARTATASNANVLGKPIPVYPASPATDPFNGADYDTAGGDLEYACTFQLPAHAAGETAGTDCSDAAIKADAPGVAPYDGLLMNICDCETALPGGGPRPLCDATTPTLQTRGKAYPTIREFSLVHDMGTNGIIASLCPRTLDATDTNNYGYNPAVSAIISRLKTQLASVCPPRTLQTDSNGLVPCQVVEVLAAGTGTCDSNKLVAATGSVLTSFQEQQAASGPNGGDAGSGTIGVNPGNICVVPNIPPSGDDCATNMGAGFCYVTGADAPSDTAAVKCGGVIKFSAGGLPSGATANLECLETSSSTSSGTTDAGATNATTGD